MVAKILRLAQDPDLASQRRCSLLAMSEDAMGRRSYIGDPRVCDDSRWSFPVDEQSRGTNYLDMPCGVGAPARRKRVSCRMLCS